MKPVGGLSHVIGPVSPPLNTQTMGDFFAVLTSTYADSPALISRHESRDVHSLDYEGGEYKEGARLKWSYGELGEKVDALARGLLKRGVRKGDRIGVVLGNGSAYAMLQWGTAKVSPRAVDWRGADPPARRAGLKVRGEIEFRYGRTDLVLAFGDE